MNAERVASTCGRVGGSTGATLVASGTGARWSPDGAQVYYVDGDRLMVVDVGLEGTPRVGKPNAVFENPGYRLTAGPNPQYDVTPDGESFLVLTEPVDSNTPSIEVVVNWTEELRRLVGSDND